MYVKCMYQCYEFNCTEQVFNNLLAYLGTKFAKVDIFLKDYIFLEYYGITSTTYIKQ